MKHLLSVIISCLIFLIACHAQETKHESKIVNQVETNTPETGWPEDVDGLLKHLNDWDKEELDVHERPDAYPNRVTSGETNGWISEHKRLLAEKGAVIAWNKEKMSYELKKE